MSRDMKLENLANQIIAHIWTKTHPNEPLVENPNPTTYWDNGGKYKEANEKLFAELVPFMGEAETLDGQALRRITKTYYRRYNDGDDVDEQIYPDMERYLAGTLKEFPKEYYFYYTGERECEACGEMLPEAGAWCRCGGYGYDEEEEE